MIEIVPATPELLAKGLDRPLPFAVRAVVAVDGDQVLAVAGIFPDQYRYVMWADISASARALPCMTRKRSMVRAMRAVLGLVKKNMPVVAAADPAIDGSRTLLEHMGFVHVTGDTYQWQPSL